MNKILIIQADPDITLDQVKLATLKDSNLAQAITEFKLEKEAQGITTTFQDHNILETSQATYFALYEEHLNEMMNR